MGLLIYREPPPPTYDVLFEFFTSSFSDEDGSDNYYDEDLEDEAHRPTSYLILCFKSLLHYSEMSDTGFDEAERAINDALRIHYNRRLGGSDHSYVPGMDGEPTLFRPVEDYIKCIELESDARRDSPDIWRTSPRILTFT